MIARFVDNGGLVHHCFIFLFIMKIELKHSRRDCGNILCKILYPISLHYTSIICLHVCTLSIIGKSTEKKLSSELQKYFEHITNSILGSDEELMKVCSYYHKI